MAATDDAVGTMSTDLGDTSYRIWAQGLNMNDSLTRENNGYLVSVVSQSVTEQTSQTTMRLIIMWSVIAVFALVGLGGWVARRVSSPLEELARGAQRIAEGDFSTKIKVLGTNEISELAESFNQMTDSLRERSENLTKKVLELATLYEMSRALGATLEMDVLLDSVLDSALRIFNLELGYITMRDRDTGQLELKSWRGSGAQAPDENALSNSMSEWVIREGRPLIFNPTDSPESAQVDMVSGALAALCVPLISPEGTIGAIIVGSHDSKSRFNSDDVRLLSTIANHVTIAIGNIELFSSLQEAYLATVRSLAAAVDAKDPYTRGHSDRVAAFAMMIAEKMGLSHEQRTALEMAAYLHDIGKIGIKEEILLKPGKLDDDERVQMTHHPLIGANILKPVGFPWPITPVVRHHHEWWSGGGYPAGLKGDEIPLLARILTVSDSYEAMTSDRPYRKGMGSDDAIEELKRCAGTQFDAKIVDVFIEVLGESTDFEEDLDTMVLDDVQHEEIRAIFVAIAEGMMGSFRRLGGPRLAANVEKELNEVFEQQGVQASLKSGRLSVRFDEKIDPSEELEIMRRSLRMVNDMMAKMSGTTLADHFYADAMGLLSERMQRLARMLGFRS